MWTLDHPLRTERLILRAHTQDDLDDLAVFHGDPAVTRYIPWPTRTREQTREALEGKLRQTAAVAPGGWIALAVEEQQSGRVVGEVLLKREADDRAEIGYVIASSRQRRGYAREAALRLIAWAEELGVTTVDAVVDERNAASVHLLRGCGFMPVPTDQEGTLRFRRTSGPTRATDSPVALDGLEFEMISSTASSVDPHAPTRFRYRQDGALVWGEYSGDTVLAGRFVGGARDDRIDVSFAHTSRADGLVAMGSAVSRAELRADGLWYLVEDFEKDGLSHRSVCRQVGDSSSG